MMKLEASVIKSHLTLDVEKIHLQNWNVLFLLLEMIRYKNMKINLLVLRSLKAR